MSTAVSPAITLSPRVGPLEAVTHALLLARRNLIKLRTNPGELIGMIAFPLVFIMLFVYIFGGAVAGNTNAYLQFALPGIMAQMVVLGSQSTGAALNTDLSNGIFDRFRSLPIARWAPLVGQLLNDVARHALGTVIVLGIGFALGFRPHTGMAAVVGAVVLLLVFAFCFGWIGTLIGVVAKNPLVVQLFSMALMFPLTFASSAFVPTQTLPGFLKVWVPWSPVSLLSETLRGLMLGGSWLEPGVKALAWAAIIFLIFAPLSVWAYRRRV
jgi:oleandomycin transport system permease protein